MKKLELKQMEKVNGGNQCDRLERRFFKHMNDPKGQKLILKMIAKC
jgi:hypothetical protein